MMELISTDDHLILHQLVQSEHALWVSRHTGEVRPEHFATRIKKFS